MSERRSNRRNTRRRAGQRPLIVMFFALESVSAILGEIMKLIYVHICIHALAGLVVYAVDDSVASRMSVKE